MERIEPETEIHRTQKAIKQLLNEPERKDAILFAESKVLIRTAPEVIALPGGQLALTLMVNLLARMKAIVREVAVRIPRGIDLHPFVPLVGGNLRSGLEHLIGSLTGQNSLFPVEFDFDGEMQGQTITLALGRGKHDFASTDIVVEADSWNAYINTPQDCSDWATSVPIGPHVAATLGVAEVFKELLLRNFPEQIKRPIRLLRNTTFSTLSYAEELPASPTSGLGEDLILDRVAIAGLGAGGSAALYTLSCIPRLSGEITLIEPGFHKRSNLARYLLSSYDDCEQGTSKVEVARAFLSQQQPRLSTRVEDLPYADVANRDFRIVLSTVDTPEARWDIQRDWPPIILDAAVMETIYAVLRVYPGEGMCLGCKHPYDPDVSWKRRAKTWGRSMEEVKRLYMERAPVTEGDIMLLAHVQGRAVEEFAELLGVPFDQVPAITECGQSHFDLRVPNQVATLPFVTTMAGVLLAAEVIKEQCAPEFALRNWFDHDMLWIPKLNRYRFSPRLGSCSFCCSLS
jgi:molybdopterin/thiamine biosynthesis adenylyltransferase